MNRLTAKVAVITGAAMGLGRATALRMAEEGAAVALLDVRDGDARDLIAQLKAQGSQATYWRCDVSSENEVRGVLQKVVHHFGRLDILVNNAGVAGVSKPTHEITEAEWDWVQAINVKGVFFCTKHAVPHLKRAGGGAIVNLSSIYGLVGGADVPPYHASKGAVRLMTKTDALLYAPDRIRVNSIHPGFIWTPMVKARLAGLEISTPAAGRPTRCIRWATSANRTTWPGAWSIWRRTRRNPSPAPSWSSTAAIPPVDLRPSRGGRPPLSFGRARRPLRDGGPARRGACRRPPRRCCDGR